MYDDTLEHRIDGAVYVDGSECIMYRVQDDRMREVEKFDIRLISQFKNGGQSSNRLERLVDENRNVFVQRVVDSCIRIFYDKIDNSSLIANLVIYGPSRFKDDVFAYKKGKLSKYFGSNSIELITTANSNQIENVQAYLSQVIDPLEEIIISEFQEMIELGDSRLEFGDDIPIQSEACMLERIIVLEEKYDEVSADLKYEPDIVIIRSAKYHSWLQSFGSAIGVRWY